MGAGAKLPVIKMCRLVNFCGVGSVYICVCVCMCVSVIWVRGVLESVLVSLSDCVLY